MGPYKDWPSANPRKKVASVRCTSAADAEKTRSRSGNDGRYMSMDSGANAWRAPMKMMISSWRIRVRLACSVIKIGKASVTAGGRTDLSQVPAGQINEDIFEAGALDVEVTDLRTRAEHGLRGWTHQRSGCFRVEPKRHHS